MKNLETAVFGGGCFWCTEAIFRNLKGVVSVMPGYAGGFKDNPSYSDVCAGDTGHAEVVKIEFDPTVISFNDLLEVFFELHDPTSLNRQGNDSGTQYRSTILYATEEQKRVVEQKIGELKKTNLYKDPIVTKIEKLNKFYPAERYHQDYYEKNSFEPYCQFVISPKLQHLKEKFGAKLKI